MTKRIPIEIQEFIKGKPGWVATASKDGTPNVAIKGSLSILDDEHLVFADLFSVKTRSNLEENPKVAVMVADIESMKGYILKGDAELFTEGPLYEKTVEDINKRAPRKLPLPKYVVKIAVSSIFDQSLGPNAGMPVD